MKITAEKVYEKYCNGDSITDAEIDFGIQVFDKPQTKSEQANER